MVEFAFPGAWLLLIPLGLNWYLCRSASKRVNVWRLLCYVTLTAALSMPSLRLPERSGTVIALVDRSLSMPEYSLAESEKIIRRMEECRPANSQLGVVSFAAGAVTEKLPDSPSFDGLRGALTNRDNSNLATGMEQALSLIPAGSTGRIMLISDGGFSGGNPEPLFARAASRGIGVDYRLISGHRGDDLYISSFDGPSRAAPGEFFTLQSRIFSPRRQTVSLRLIRNGEVKKQKNITLNQGENFLSWRDICHLPTVLEYSLDIDVKDDVPENNRGVKLVEIAGRKPLLLLTESPSGNLGKMLSKSGFPAVIRKPSPKELTPAKLSGCSGVILENVPADKLGMEGMELLKAMVGNGAMGLMITGGRSSFAAGGYFRSPLDDVLPVSMEQRQEVRKSSVALMVALDRSGSMSVPVGSVTKMDMANMAAAESLNQLLPTDEFGVIAVDFCVHNVVPLAPVGENKRAIERKIRSIESMGGGIYTYTALREAVRQLKKSNMATRHILLFADAADAEEPGDYRRLLKAAADEGITVSVAGLGRPDDVDAVFLKDIAQRGQGACYFTERAEDLPRIFVQDTFMISRNTFIDTPVQGRFTQDSQLISGIKARKIAEFGGYNLCFPKPDSRVLIVSEDEFAAPIAATGHYGQGRVTAFTAEADGKYTGKFAGNPDAGVLLPALANAMRVAQEGGSDYLVTQRMESGALVAEIHLDPGRESDPWRSAPKLNAIIHRKGVAPEQKSFDMEWTSADTVTGRIPLNGGESCLSTVSWPGKSPVVLSPVKLHCSPEYLPAVQGTDIKELSAISGGAERLTAGEIWQALPRSYPMKDISSYLYILAVFWLLIETADRRLGFRFNLKFASKVREDKAVKRRKNTAPPEKKAETPKASEPEDDLSQALRKARRR